MGIKTIKFLYDYNDWANDIIYDAYQQLTQADLIKLLPGSTASLRDRFVHIIGAEELWLLRWKGEHPTALPEWTKDGGLNVIGEQMRQIREERNRMLASVTEEDLAVLTEFKNMKGDLRWNLRLGEMLLHVANHSNYHRGQIATAARAMGFVPPPIDLLLFASARNPIFC